MPGEVLNVLKGHVLIEEIGHDRDPEAVRGEEVRQARIRKTPLHHLPHGVCPVSCRRQLPALAVGPMRGLDAESVDFILTDPPYLVNYRSRDGRRVLNDDNDAWLAPAFAEMFRILKDGSLCVSFYGWDKTDLFMAAWRAAGLWIVAGGHHTGLAGRRKTPNRFLKPPR